ncbi:MAG: hypothetical protein QXU69_07965 [Thermofilaceae archaeon]
MIIRVDGKSYKLDWRGIAVLLSLRWVRFNALPLTRLQAVEPDIGKLKALINDLKAMGLVGELTVKRSIIVYLTENGAKVAEKLETIAREAQLI